MLITLKADIRPPTAPVLGSPTALSTTSISVPLQAAATDPSGVTSYSLEYSTSLNGTYVEATAAAVFPQTVTGLTPSTQYFFRARAVDSYGNAGPYSGIVSTTTQDAPPVTGLSWPAHVPGYLSLIPGVGGYGMNTVAGSGRHLATPATTVILVNSLAAGNSGGALTGLGANVFGGTWEYAWRHTASPKTIIPVVGGWVTIQDSILNPSAYVSYYGQAAPSTGLYLRGAKPEAGAGGNMAIWHLRSYMGDDVTGLPAGGRDCFGSGNGLGTTQQVVLINCEFAWSVDEIIDFNRSHNQITFIGCAFIEPLHLSTIVHPEDGPGVDHGFGPIVGGDTGQAQTSAVSTFRNLWAHTTGRNPLVSAQTFVHANNLHYNHGRPTGGAGNGVQIIGAGATQANFANILGNGFVRGPNNNTSLVAITAATTLPAGSAGYSFANCQFGWTAPANQGAFFTSSPTGYSASTVQSDAYPGSWGSGLTAVLQWASNPLAPTLTEWSNFVTLMDRTVGAQPRWRTTQYGRVAQVFNQIRDRINGVAQTDQFVDTVTEAGGWFTVPSVTINPLNPGSHWHAPLPTGSDRDTPYTSGTFSDGKSRVGYTRLEEWAYEQHLYVTSLDQVAPSVPTSVVATALSTSTIRITWAASTDTGGVGVAGYRVYRATTSAGPFTQVGADIAVGTHQYDDASLGASTTRYYQVSAFDWNGNESSTSVTASATTQSSGSSGWADMYGNAAGIAAGISVDGRRYGVRGTDLSAWGPYQTSGNGGQLFYRAAQSFDGAEPVIECRPPTLIEQSYNTILGGPIHRGGLNNIKQINFRWLEYIGPRYWDMSTGLRPKWSGFFISASQSTELNSNRVGIFDAPNNTTGTVYPCVTAATVQTYNYPPEGYNVNVGADSTKLIAIRGTNNHSLNAPQTGGGEWICFEQVVDCMQTRGNPFGRHELRVWTRDRAANGRFLRIPLNWDGGWNFARQFIYSAEGLGAYYNGTATAHADNYKLWSHCTFAANMGIDDLIGPPPGFLL